MNYLTPQFPTALHEKVAIIASDFFRNYAITDTVLIVNSCARGQAVAESDIDIAILAKEKTSYINILTLDEHWQYFMQENKVIRAFKNSGVYTHVHLDIVNGVYVPKTIENGEPIDYFEVEIGNQICYAAPMYEPGEHFKKLRKKWLDYYDEELRLTRLEAIKSACAYDLNHIPHLIKRGLFFHAFDALYKALQEYLQALFIANKVYPLAYNKWIKYQVKTLLNKPGLYADLTQIISLKHIESDELNNKVALLYSLLNHL